MACDLSDPQISQAYHRILDYDGIDWMIIGYGNTRGTLSLYSTGGGGVAEMALSVPNEIIFGFLTFEGSNVLVTHVSEKISGVRRARGLAHQRSVAEFFDRYDITVNTTKPTELTPVLLRGKTRHLAIKSFPMSAGSLGRSDSTQPSKVRSTVWHQNSQSSSRASSPSTASLVGNTASEPTGAPAAAFSSSSKPETLAIDNLKEASSAQPTADAEIQKDTDSSSDAQTQSPDTVSPTPGMNSGVPTRPQSRRAPEVPLAKIEEALHEVPLTTPPTPNSFHEAAKLPTNDASSDDEVFSDKVNRNSTITVEEMLAADSPVLTEFDTSLYEQTEYMPDELGSPVTEPSLATTAAAEASTSRFANPNRASVASGAHSLNVLQSSVSIASPSTPIYQRYSSARSIDRPMTSTSLNRRSRVNPISQLVAAPVSPEVAKMLDVINQHRQVTADLALNSGILGDKYFKCLRGYTSIQEPSNNFWKRRYFVISDKTLFLYINECSRMPTDHWLLSSVVRAPRRADDDVLMPNALALDFGSGEHFLFFDSAAIRKSFEQEVLTAMNSSDAAIAN